MNFSRFLDIQSWWEVPSIAYFCSLFRSAFNLLDFDIEELEEALLTDGTEESASSLLTELIVRLLNGCLGNNDISAFNYQMYLRRLFRRKCQETGRYNPFDSDIDFQFLPLRTKVEILYALCDFRLDADDVFELFKNLEAESLRVEPLGWDDNDSAYWYFYGTRLYREDVIRKSKGKNKKKRVRESRKRGWFYGDDWLDDEETEKVWQVVCFTEEDWTHLTEKFSKATSKVEKELYRSLSQNFLPEIPRLFQEKERLQRKRLLETAPRRTSSRVLQKIKQKEEEVKQSAHEAETEERKEAPKVARENRAKRRSLLRRSKSASSDNSDSSEQEKEAMPQTISKRSKSQDKRSKNSSATQKGEPPPAPPVKTGRKTNNSLSAATGQIVIPENVEPVNSTRRKLKTSQIFTQTEEDIQTDMYKVLEQLTSHEDAWPFVDPVEEDYAPNYYSVIRRPMDLRKMEERLDSGYYTEFSMFQDDFKLIVNNCRLYNGQANEYTTMVSNLQAEFDRLTEKYIHRLSSSDEEIAVEYQLPTPSRKHKIKPSESPNRQKRKKRQSHSESTDQKSSPTLDKSSSSAGKSSPAAAKSSSSASKSSTAAARSSPAAEKSCTVTEKSSTATGKSSSTSGKSSLAAVKSSSSSGKSIVTEKSNSGSGKSSSTREREKSSTTPGKGTASPHHDEDEKQNDSSPEAEVETKKSKESRKSKQGKGKKKHKGHHRKHHHRHGKHSKNRKNRKDSHKSEHNENSTEKKHSKKQKHSKNKDKEGKKSKEKKKKNKHQEPEPPKLERALSQESLESSNRSRSASPLPSIHTPSPSPTELDQPSEQTDQLNDSEFYKDKYDKIKERRRTAAKDAWDTLIDHKHKSGGDKQKQNLTAPEKDKNPKLRETIEKLKAKNEKYKESSLFNSLFTSTRGNADKNSDSSLHKDSPSNDGDENPFSDDESEDNQRSKNKGNKKNTAKNESASEALEQAVKDISKWLDDAPKGSVGSSPSDSPAQTISTEEHDNSRHEDELFSLEKSIMGRKDVGRKRPSSREPKLLKRREIQRTIDRLQPGKSKGNLLTNISNKNSEKAEELVPSGQLSKVRDSAKAEESSPKLSLGSVLQTVDFTLGKDHNFDNSENKNDVKDIQETSDTDKNVDPKEEALIEKKNEEKPVQANKKDVEVETEPCSSDSTKPSQEKATPNLSAWFKAFGAPKSTSSTPSTKKKVDDPEIEEKSTDAVSENKSVSPKNATKYDSPTDPYTPNPEGGDSPLPNALATPRQRRTSTGSSVSERSSFSQDLDSPRHQMSHNSPLLRSPASPRTDDFQKITYPIINGTVRAGFYQDTTSIKSSPDKSCSPREGPQSPYSPYSQHVYASNNAMGSSTPNYFVDHNKSPLPSYGQNPPPYYENSKGSVNNKNARSQDEYSALATDSYQQNQYSSQYSSANSPYSQMPASNYSQGQNSPQSAPTDSTSQVSVPQTNPDPKTTLFPVKKRTYNEPETIPVKKASESKDVAGTIKNDYQKISQSLHSMSSLPTSSVDNIALALSEKSEMAKMSSVRDKPSNYIDRNIDERDNIHRNIEARDNTHYENNESSGHAKKDHSNIDANKPIGIIKNDNVDMINMGYMNPEIERRSSGDAHEDFPLARDIQKSNLNHHQKGYDVDAIAINLGLNNQHMQKTHSKPSTPNIPPAHVHERTHNEAMNQNMAHVHHSQYDAITGGQSISNFSLNDIELANKKLYTCNPASSTAALDYGNWKMANTMRKQDMHPSDYSNSYSSSADKLKSDNSTTSTAAINYKNIQQQYNNYNVPRTGLQRAHELQQNLPSELRIPNPRGLLKHDHMTVTSSISDTELNTKNIDTLSKSQKSDKHVQNHPLVSTIQYKTSYGTHSSHPLDSLRNIPNIPQMLERYSNEDRYLSSFAGPSSLYHDKTFQMAQMFNKSMTSDVHTSQSGSMYSEPSSVTAKDSGIYKTTTNISNIQADAKAKAKKKRTADTKSTMSAMGGQSYASTCGTDVLSPVKSMMPGSAFNFGSSANMGLGSGLYGDNGGFSIEDFRNSATANQLMAANYMAAAVAHQQRNNAEAAAVEKLVKPAHQNSTHTSGSFPFIGHSQVRAGYPFVGADPSSPLYQQYLQRHQEEILRQTGAQIMGLYPGYPTGLGVRQPFDSINRPSWL